MSAQFALPAPENISTPVPLVADVSSVLNMMLALSLFPAIGRMPLCHGEAGMVPLVER